MNTNEFTNNGERVLYYNKNTKEIIMPDEMGVMNKPAPMGEGWLWVRWPVNPHFTGETGIIDMLSNNYFVAAKGKVNG
jgi:hypothetical protein